MLRYLIFAALAQTVACGDPELAPGKSDASAKADAATDATVLADTQPADAMSAEAEAAEPDAPTAELPEPDLPPIDTATDTDLDAPPDIADVTPTDIADATDTAPDVPPACANCLFTQPPAAPHPGSQGTLDLTPPYTISYGKGGFGEGYKGILIVRPFAPGPWPVLFFVPAEGLNSGGGLVQKLGHPYLGFLEHVARHGYIAAFVQVEASAIDDDHPRMADDLLAAVKATYAQLSMADSTKMALAGHGLGAKVALWAAWKVLNLDLKGEYPQPAAVLLFGLHNKAPLLGTFHDVCQKAKEIVPQSPTWFTFVQADDDDKASWKESGKPNAQGCYQALQTVQKQLLVLHGTGPGDKNAATQPELHDDAAAPLSVEGAMGSVADLSWPQSHLDALDWYGYWKWTVGALDHHWKGGDAAWAYGALRTHGGLRKDGSVIEHEVKDQGFK
jgi:hypothetical protein